MIPGERATISGKYLDVPCVYIWRREYRALYVGSSMGGLGRPTSADHHVIGVFGIEPDDEVEFIFYPGINEDDLRAKEEEMICSLRPAHNRTGNNGSPHIMRPLEPHPLDGFENTPLPGDLPLSRASRRLNRLNTPSLEELSKVREQQSRWLDKFSTPE